MFVHSWIFGISYIDYFTMFADFTTLLVDQMQNMLLDDAFYIWNYIIGIIWPVWTGHNATQFSLAY